ncbi:MAG: transposase [Hyphomonadaceae bacterium]|nr:transposase [Hyphomonadaceae bacterium]
MVAPAREGHRRRFSTAERQQIIAEAEQPGASVSDVVRRFGIDRRLLCRWRQEAAAVAFVAVEICDAQTPTEERAP